VRASSSELLVGVAALATPCCASFFGAFQDLVNLGARHLFCAVVQAVEDGCVVASVAGLSIGGAVSIFQLIRNFNNLI
jgi:hypothetical protein